MPEIEATNWFVAQLQPQGLARARIHLQRQGFATFCPEILSSTQRAGRSYAARKPLFPGYLFVQFDPKVPGWNAINATRGVSRLILNNPRRPTPLPSALVAGLRARCDGSDLITTSEEFAVGDRIRVLSGPFADLVTTIDALPEQDRIGVLIELMGREVRTSLPRTQIARVD